VLRKIEYWHQSSISSFNIMCRDSKGFWHDRWDGKTSSCFVLEENRRAKGQQEVVYRRLREFELVGLFEADLGPIGLMYDQFKGENSTSGTMGFLLDCPTLQGSTATDA
jgi:hypothetical protein